MHRPIGLGPALADPARHASHRRQLTRWELAAPPVLAWHMAQAAQQPCFSPDKGQHKVVGLAAVAGATPEGGVPPHRVPQPRRACYCHRRL
jgi:hypothetical protein